MYAEAGKPSKTQELTRDILHRLFVGSDIGQGYCGDEDNGEMSSWYILSMLGLYDLALGKNQYVITSPLLNNVTVNRDNGSLIRIVTDDNSGNERFIKSAKLDNNN
jgi:putative alpha-1,2-mannosidase